MIKEIERYLTAKCINTLYLNNENLNFDIVNKLFSDNRRIANEKNGLIFLKAG